MRDAFVRGLLSAAQADPLLTLVTGDLGFGVLKPFQERYPERFINAGVAEQAMMSLAAGLAADGRTVVVYSIGNFPTLRCLEQIRNDCAYHRLPVKIVCVGGGFTYGNLGMSHHATEDLGVLRTLPDVTLFAPGDPVETEAVLPAFFTGEGTAYLRLGRSGSPVVHQNPPAIWQLPQAIPLCTGTDTALLSAGGILPEVMRAVPLLRAAGISAGVVSFPCLKPFDAGTVRALAARYRMLFTVEEHQVIGGLGAAVCEAVAEAGLPCRVVRLGLRDVYTRDTGSEAALRRLHGLDAEGIAEAVRRDV